MNHQNETFETWNNIANLYQEKFMDLELYNHTYDYFCNSLEKLQAKILEIGCGPGNVTKYLLSKRPNLDILGVDIAPNMITLAKQNNPKAHFQVMDAKLISQIHSTFDGIIGGFCLPYFNSNESKSLLLDISKMLNNKGILYLSFVEGAPQDSGFKAGSAGRVYFNYHLLDELKSQLIDLRFEVLKTFHVPYPTKDTASDIHTILVAQKTSALQVK